MALAETRTRAGIRDRRRRHPLRQWLVGLGAALTLLLLPSLPATAAGKQAYEAAVSAARAGDYRQAVAQFQEAREAGYDTPALHFNLGVSFFRLGRLDSAVAAFRRAAETPEMGAPAAYNLGRIARDRGQLESAIRWLEQAAERAGTQAVADRALAALRELDTKPEPAGLVLAAIGSGYATNISLSPSDSADASREESPFLYADLFAEHPLQSDWSLTGAIYTERYTSADGFDLTSLRGGAVWRPPEAPWPELSFAARHMRFGGEAFENAFLAGARFQRLAPVGIFTFGAGVDAFQGASGFEFLDGTRRRAHVGWLGDGPGGDWRLRYRFWDMSRDDGPRGDKFRSQSYDRHTVSAALERPWLAESRMRIEVTWAGYRYADRERRNGEALDRRTGSNLRLGVRVARNVWRGWRIEGEMATERRHSNFDEFEYRRHRLALRLERAW